MDKNEITKILDEFSDTKLDIFLEYLRDLHRQQLKETERNGQE